ncbi:hypothetical protein F5887DRAFT_925638 [Amanita rubescens]|nr:hypothetical protein F5887DRAFT_925638 [Amanita rubescens]
MSTIMSINLSTNKDEGHLNVSFMNNINTLDTILSTGNGTPNMPSKPVPNVYPETLQAHNWIHKLESQLGRNDALVGEALKMMFRTKRQEDEIDDLSKKQEVARGIDAFFWSVAAYGWQEVTMRLLKTCVGNSEKYMTSLLNCASFACTGKSNEINNTQKMETMFKSFGFLVPHESYLPLRTNEMGEDVEIWMERDRTRKTGEKDIEGHH